MDKTEKNIFVAEWHEILNKNVLLSIPNLRIEQSIICQIKIVSFFAKCDYDKSFLKWYNKWNVFFI